MQIELPVNVPLTAPDKNRFTFSSRLRSKNFITKCREEIDDECLEIKKVNSKHETISLSVR
jgi:hypothetical protein